ncbi:hypothetical protein B0H14DRAFT_2592456 [Mycena olivaceomarginata]|nr:hypothetical protein B0H14DRAFT_2592456 [Mycena olivaceomarginata]
MEIPLADLETVLMDRIGHVGYFWSVKTQADIEKHRKQFTFNPPKVIADPDCPTPAICEITWRREWNTTVPKVVHHPDVHTRLADLFFSLEETEITDLCDGCRKLTVRWIWGTGYATAEEDIIKRILTAIPTIRAALRDVVVHGPNDPPSATTPI